ncbi:MAG: hypothetical protein Q7U76_03360 [Nitrospirota bacterium]|nr:hypothetical protein [Nitrospirota bacterium]
MEPDKELESLAHQIASLEKRFVQSSSLGMYLQSEDEAQFSQLVAESISLIDSLLGEDNNFSRNIARAVNNGNGGYIEGPSYACVQKTRGLITAAANHLMRVKSLSPKATTTNPSSYVAPERLTELKSATSLEFDLTRLVRLCEELNVAYTNNCMMTIAMLVRAIVDHVPPIFKQLTFTQVVNNYAGSKAFKGSMQQLDGSLRNIANAHLHTHVRSHEVLPTFTQVDFRSDLDVLLSEVIRVLKT